MSRAAVTPCIAGPRSRFQKNLAGRLAFLSFRNPRSATRDRKGILLLVVLSLLVLFLLVGTSFVISSNQYRKANKTLAAAAAPETAKNPLQHQDLFQEVLDQLVRDTTNPYSSLRYHSLLRDLYGEDGFSFELPTGGTGTATIGFAPNTGGQLIRITLQFTTPPALSQINGYYNGLVWTMADGFAAGQSVRIVNYRHIPAGAAGGERYQFDVMGPEHFTGLPAAGDRVVINGRPFNGTGVGYNPEPTLPPTVPKLNSWEGVFDVQNNRLIRREIALMPNGPFFGLGGSVIVNYGNQMNGLGGSDESYDAVDFQNMFLAMAPASPSETQNSMRGDPTTWPPTLPPELGNIVIPSFHRPALIKYWANQAALQTEPNLLRKVMLRPSWFDHPNFTGSNPELTGLVAAFRTAATPANIATASGNLLARMIYGPWDVDNDNDGRRDSEWVDFGAPVMMGPQGKLVKPLAAILCVDLDGRLNLNAHGTLLMADLEDDPDNDLNIEIPLAGNTGDESDDLPRGQGYGPAEISLESVVGDVAGLDLFSRLLTGVNAGDSKYNDGQAPYFDRSWGGRYGRDNTTILADRGPGVFDAAMGFGYDLMAQLKQQGLPKWASTAGTYAERLGNYATPPDLKGRYGMGLNALGQPVYEAALDTAVSLDQDSPYELDLSRVGPHSAGDSAKDGPFSLAELERILRAYDPDASKLPSRLWELANQFRPAPTTAIPTPVVDTGKLNDWRAYLTTDSFDLPVPNVVAPEWVRLGPNGVPDATPGTSDDFADVMDRQPVNLTFADLLEYRLRVGLGILDPATITQPQRDQIAREMSKLMPPELEDGLRLDLNRPIGNGRDDGNGLDDDGDGQFDEADEFGIDPLMNGVVDEPGENEGANWKLDRTRGDALVSSAAASRFETLTRGTADFIDRNGDGMIELWERGDADGDGALSQTELVKLHNFRRQLLARHLYVLAMTLVDPLPQGATADVAKARARHLAQWAINVVDFRDPDNIMTAFEYDANPFDGWGFVDGTGTFKLIDGDLETTDDVYGADNKFGGTGANADPGGVVWGAERPELLITETLAWHDRNTFDSQRESVNSLDEPDDEAIEDGIGDVRSGADMTFDQELRPEGAAFIELYNPWTADTAANADIHSVDPTTGEDLGINLARVSDVPRTPNGSDYSPVWRMTVYRGGGLNLNPDDPDTTKRPNNLVWLEKRRPPLRIDQIALPINQKAEKSIYFTNFDPADRDGADRDGDGIPDGDGTPDDVDGDGTIDWDGEDGIAFFTSQTVDPVRPGRYMVVAGVDTGPGSGQVVAPGEYLVKYGLHQLRGIRLDTRPVATNAVSVLDSTGMPVRDAAGFDVASPAEGLFPELPGIPGFNSMASVAIIDRAVPNRFYDSPSRRFTFSEPAGGYPDRVPLHNSRSVAGAPSGWNPNPALRKYQPVMDRPLDERRAFDPDSLIYDPDAQVPPGLRDTIKRNLRGNGNDVASPTSLNDGETRLALPDDDRGIRTLPGFSWVYLQRLANPTLPWNPEPFLPNGQANPKHKSGLAVNPYRTIDVSGVNVTVFNGQSTDERQWPPGVDRDASQPKIYSNAWAMRSFASVQRGRTNDPSRDVGNYMVMQDMALSGIPVPNRFFKNPHDPALVEPILENLWSPEPIDLNAYWSNRGGPLGFGMENPRSGSFFDAVPDCTLGFLNEPYRDPAETNVDRQRVFPENPFPWFTWNNRPYISSGELLEVPAHAVAELPRTFAMVRAAQPQETYTGSVDVVAPDLELDGPYSYLMNFFRTQSDPNIPNTVTPPIAGLYRVLDYVGVPSRFVGTETWLNPTSFGSAVLADVFDARYGHQPPFNKISNYRDPGRVNINTIGAPDPGGPGGARHVWDGIFHENPKYAGNRGAFAAIDDDGLYSVRRGYGTFGDNVTQLDPGSPTLIANPFRAAGAGDLVPIPSMVRADVDGTMLRSMGDPPFMGSSNVPGIQPQGVPLFSTGSEEPYRDAKRNPYFRYQPLTRLESMATTHSNVYAVWVTIGFFEVEEAPDRDAFANRNGFGTTATAASNALYARVYPEGYQLGQEMGSDTGDFQRLRGFAIVDRSIPVAFEPGEDNNVERAVRLRRRIE